MSIFPMLDVYLSGKIGIVESSYSNNTECQNASRSSKARHILGKIHSAGMSSAASGKTVLCIPVLRLRVLITFRVYFSVKT